MSELSEVIQALKQLRAQVQQIAAREKADWDVVSRDTAHARDIRDVALTRHLPDPTGGAAGEIAVSDGTNWDLSSTTPFSLIVNVRTEVAVYTATASDTVILCDATGGAFTVNLPAAAGVTGLILYIKKIDGTANVVTVDGAGAETIDGALTQVIAVQYDSITLVPDGANWSVI